MQKQLRFLVAFSLALVALLLSSCQEEPVPTESPVSPLPPAFESPVTPQSLFSGVMAFHSDRSGSLQVYTLEGETGDVTRVTDDPAGAFEPTWSPDCQALAYASKQLDPNAFELYTVGRDGSGEMRLTVNQPADDWSPAWSPVHNLIAFQTTRDQQLNVCFIDLDGEFLGCLEGGYNKASPAWSSDGSRLLFIGDQDGDWDVFVTSYPDLSEPVRLTDNDVPDMNPQFSPDGQYIAFSSKPVPTNYDIFLMNADGTGLTPLFQSESDDSNPYWVGNDTIAFASQRSTDWELYLINRDGSNLVRLTNTPGLDKWPVWCAGE